MNPDRMIDPEENKSTETGSPLTGGPAYLTVGKFRRPHGLDGEIILEVLTDFPERLRKGRKVYVGNQYRPIVLKAIRPHGRFPRESWRRTPNRVRPRPV